jgi:acyl-CoA synthetase (AMP-forming)/AMP-acid ligase II
VSALVPVIDLAPWRAAALDGRDDRVLWFADRYKDVIKTGGENVASIEAAELIGALRGQLDGYKGRRP